MNQFLEGILKEHPGKHVVIGVDKFDYEPFFIGAYTTAATAVRTARKMTTEDKPLASDHTIATIYYAYTPTGKYLGGDTWVGE